jgi:dTDP-4-amino-4,6-dideoxygalactose transaminase
MSRISLVQLARSVRKFNLNRPFICPILAYHMYYLLMPDIDSRTRYISYLKERKINAVFHYQPLHLSPMGRDINGDAECDVTEDVSNCVVRLPFFNGITNADMQRVIDATNKFAI